MNGKGESFHWSMDTFHERNHWEILSADDAAVLVIPHPVHDYAVLKGYLAFLKKTTENLEIKHIFAHAYKAVVSKLLELVWVNGNEFLSCLYAITKKPTPA